ncbi:MAG: hypothetical protein ACK48B_07435 [Dolichospermum sp.]
MIIPDAIATLQRYKQSFAKRDLYNLKSLIANTRQDQPSITQY